MTLIDIGANLAHDSFDADRDAVIERAAAAGVSQLVITGSDAASSAAAIDMAQRYRGRCFATAGLHPHHASDWNGDLANLMRCAAGNGDVVALGETGLDYFRDICPRDVQQQAFAAQLALAAETGLPVFLHQRHAHADFVAILREHLPALSRVVVHCFTDTATALADYLALDAYIGITGWICDERRGRALFESVHAIPDHRLMLETDSPYLMPRNVRPKPKTRRNEPAHLPWIAECIAAARTQTVDHIAAITRTNAQRFFALPEAG